MTAVPRTDLALPMVGRARELKTLLDALELAGRGQPGAVVVAGDAGVGKTRLLREVAEHAARSGAVVLVGHCLDVGGVGLPYLPFTEAFQSLPGAGDSALPMVPEAWHTAPGAGGDVSQLQLFDAVSAALAEAGRDSEGPVLLVVEDLHWADQSSRHLLAFLLGRLRDERLLVLASYRTDDLHRRHPLRPLLAQLARLPAVERLELRPFDAEEMGAYLRGLGSTPIEGGVVQQIFDRSEGNAYYAQELLNARSTGQDSRPLPADLAEVLLARLEQLPAEAQQVAWVASVAGRRVGHELLSRVSGLAPDDVEGALREAVTHLVLETDGDAYSFRHALLAEAVYADLLPGERVRLHATYARVIAEAGTGRDALGSAAELAHHCLESHDLPGALEASVRAATQAEALHAPAEAWQHLERVLQLWDAVDDAATPAGGDLVELSLRAAAAAGRAGELARAAALADFAAQRLDPSSDPALAALVQQTRASHLYNHDRPGPALDAATEALRLGAESGGGPTTTSAWAAATAARALLSMDRDDEARRLAERARDDAARTACAGAEADALVTLAALDNVEGKPSSAAALLARALEQARAAGDLATELRVSHALAVDRYDAGDLAVALPLVDSAVDRCVATGLSWSVYGLELRSLQVTARFVVGDWPGSVAAAQLATPRPPAPADARLAASSLYVAVASGDPGAAALVAQLDGAWHHDAAIALVAGACGSELLLWQERPAEALEYAERALRYVAEAWDEQWFLGGIRLSALGLAAAGDLAEQARLLRDTAGDEVARAAGAHLIEHARATALRGRPRGGGLGPEGRAWLLRAEAEHSRVEGRADPDLWRRTVEAFGYGHCYEEARSRWRLAAALLSHDRRRESEEQARAAHAVARELGAAPLAAAVVALARRGRLDLGVDVERSAATADDGLLTPREREVLALLAQGRTNRQIGAQLFIAGKTASVHVSNILGKLGASSRTEAVSLAHRAGLLPDAGGRSANPPD